MFSIPDLALGAICAAAIAGGVSLLSLIISKENKTSDFRQAWVDALREETTSLISDYRIFAHYKAQGLSGPTVIDLLLKVRACQTSIRLRLKPSEELTKVAVGKIQVMDDIIERGDWRQDVVEKAALDLEKAIQPILKENWDRVKSGEPWFKATRWITSGVIIIAFTVIALRALDFSPAIFAVSGTVSSQPAPAAPLPDARAPASLDVLASQPQLVAPQEGAVARSGAAPGSKP